MDSNLQPPAYKAGTSNIEATGAMNGGRKSRGAHTPQTRKSAPMWVQPVKRLGAGVVAGAGFEPATRGL